MTGHQPNEFSSQFKEMPDDEPIHLKEDPVEGENVPPQEAHDLNTSATDNLPQSSQFTRDQPSRTDPAFKATRSLEHNDSHAYRASMVSLQPPPPPKKRPRYPYGFPFIFLLLLLCVMGNQIEGLRANITAGTLSMLGPTFPSSIEARIDAGLILDRNGAHGDAQDCLERAAKDSETYFGKNNYKTIYANIILADAFQKLYSPSNSENYYDRSVTLMEEYLPLLDHAVGTIPADIGDKLYFLGWAFGDYGEADLAARIYKAAAPFQKDRNKWRYVNCFIYQGEQLSGAGKYKEAQPVLEEALKLMPMLSSDDRKAESMTWYGKNLNELGRYTEAEKTLREALPVAQAVLGPAGWYTLRIKMELARALSGQGRTSEATALLDQVFKTPNKRDWDTAYANVVKANILRDAHQFAKAEELYKTAITNKKNDEDGPYLSWIEEQYAKMKDMQKSFAGTASKKP